MVTLDLLAILETETSKLKGRPVNNESSYFNFHTQVSENKNP